MVKIATVIFCSVLILIEVSDALFDPTNNRIDLRSLPAEAFISPKKSAGDRVEAWTKSKTSPNPEELGEYFEGDILFPGGNQRNGLINTSYRWPRKIVPYRISGTFSSSALLNIKAAINNFNTKSCVRFVQRFLQRDYISFTSDKTGCWSSVGKIGGRQRVNLQDPGCTITGIVEHELLHALGFYHEQSRPDRDTHVKISLENVVTGMEHNFNKYSNNVVTTFNTSYDHGSVMHYSSYAFSSNGNPTITTIPAGIPIGQRDGMSAKDIQKLNAMYNCA